MKLLKLYSNMNSFNTIKFNPYGINIILAEKNEKNIQIDKKNKKTINGVGKSLTITIIHFCLGSNSLKCFEKQLKDWEFYLDIEITEVFYTIKRKTSLPDFIYIKREKEDFKKYKLDEFKKYFGSLIFNINKDFKYLSFRNLIRRFIRPQRESYNDYNNFINKEQDYSKLLNTGYLLDLDINLIDKKRKLKEELTEEKNSLKYLRNNEIYKKHFEVKTIVFQIHEIKDKLEKAINEKNNFKIAENYNNIEKEVKKISLEMSSLNNYIVLLESNLKKIELSISKKIDISKKDIENLYKELKIYFSSQLKKKLTEIEDFHNDLILNRNIKLDKEKGKNLRLLNEKRNELKLLEEKYNKKSIFLEKHGTLEKYETIVNNIRNLKEEIKNLTAYKKLETEHNKKILSINEEITKKDKKGADFINNYDNKANKFFNNFSKIFYDNKFGGIDIKNKVGGRSKNRFEIIIKIQDDASDGVKSVGIFSFDLTLLLLGINHKIKFLFHDNRLFSDIEPNQRRILFNIINDKLETENFQYICSLNEEQLNGLKEICSEDEFKKIIGGEKEKNIVLKLSDKDDSRKLLGVHIDLKYDKEMSFGSEND
jgi:uncharacterized protein YydD (DUF2326 family)